jgi:hypothetical protein
VLQTRKKSEAGNGLTRFIASERGIAYPDMEIMRNKEFNFYLTCRCGFARRFQSGGMGCPPMRCFHRA